MNEKVSKSRCQHPRLRSFTFSNGDAISKCLDCSFGVGHYDQVIPSGEMLYVSKSRPVLEPEPFEEDVETDNLPELTVEDILRPPIEEEPMPVLVEEDEPQEDDLDSETLSERICESDDAMQYAEECE